MCRRENIVQIEVFINMEEMFLIDIIVRYIVD